MSSSRRYAARRSGRSAASRNSQAAGSASQQQPRDEHAPRERRPAPPHLERAHGAHERREGESDFDRKAAGSPAGPPHGTEPDEANGDRRSVGQDAVFLVEQETRNAARERPGAHLRAGGPAVRRRRPRGTPDEVMEREPRGGAQRERRGGGRDEACARPGQRRTVTPDAPDADGEQDRGHRAVLRVQPRQGRRREAEQQRAPSPGRRSGRAAAVAESHVADGHRGRRHDRERRRDLRDRSCRCWRGREARARSRPTRTWRPPRIPLPDEPSATRAPPRRRRARSSG